MQMRREGRKLLTVYFFPFIRKHVFTQLNCTFYSETISKSKIKETFLATFIVVVMIKSELFCFKLTEFDK